MNITILNGNPDSSNTGFDSYLTYLSEILGTNGHTITNFTLRDMDIHYCIGCFGCWVKTPGECAVAADDSIEIRKAAINSDLIIQGSPVIMGFTSALLKKVWDKMIPLVMPYIGIYQGESHHLPRYDKYPRLGVLIEPEPDTDNEDIDIIHKLFQRNSINFHTELAFFHSTTDPIEEVANEINGL